MKIKETILRYWRSISTPSKYYSLGFLSLGGFVMGILFWGAFNTAMEFTNSEPFCTSCHQNLYLELQDTIHFTNRSGVRAICSSCQVPRAGPRRRPYVTSHAGEGTEISRA